VGIPKESLTAATPSIAGFGKQEGISTGFDVQPALDLDNGASPLPAMSSDRFVSSFDQFDIPADFISGGEIFEDFRNTIDANQPNPPEAHQPGSHDDIDTGGDTRFSSNVVLRNGFLWAVQSMDGGGRAAIQWFQIDPSTHKIDQTGVISDPSLDLYYPSITVTANNDVIIGFSGSDDSTPISTYVVVGRTVNGKTYFGNITQTHLGNGEYEILDPTRTQGANRWGGGRRR